MKLLAILEHKDWLGEQKTVDLIQKVMDHLHTEAEKYKKRDDYKGDDPITHVKEEFFEKVSKKCNKK